MRPLRSEVSEQSLILMGVPKKYTSKTLKNFRDYGNADLKEVRDFCEDYVENIEVNIEEGRGIFFYGIRFRWHFLILLPISRLYLHIFQKNICISISDRVTFYGCTK